MNLKEQVCVRIDQETAAKIEAIASDEDRPLGAVARRLICRALADYRGDRASA